MTVAVHGAEPVYFGAAGPGKPLELQGNWPVRRNEVEELVSVLAGLKSRFQPVPVGNDEHGQSHLKPYGLAASQDPVVVTVALAGNKSHTLAFGEAPAEPGENPFTRPAFVRVDDQPEVLRVGPDVLPVLKRPAEFYRKRQLFPDAARVKVADSEKNRAESSAQFLLQNAVTQIRVDGPQGKYVLKRPGPEPGADHPARQAGRRGGHRRPAARRCVGNCRAGPRPGRPGQAPRCPGRHPGPVGRAVPRQPRPDVGARGRAARRRRRDGCVGCRPPGARHDAAPLRCGRGRVPGAGRPQGRGDEDHADAPGRLDAGPPGRQDDAREHAGRGPDPAHVPRRPAAPAKIIEEKFYYAKLADNPLIFEIKGDRLADVLFDNKRPRPTRRTRSPRSTRRPPAGPWTSSATRTRSASSPEQVVGVTIQRPGRRSSCGTRPNPKAESEAAARAAGTSSPRSPGSPRRSR